MATFVKERNDHIALVLNIESRKGLRDMEKLCAVPGVDAIVVGPHDLSCNLGVPEDFTNPIFQNALKEIFQKARKLNIGAGIHQGMPPDTPGMTPEFATKWIGHGCNVYIHGADVGLFSCQLKNGLSEIRKATGTEVEGGSKKRKADMVI